MCFHFRNGPLANPRLRDGTPLSVGPYVVARHQMPKSWFENSENSNTLEWFADDLPLPIKSECCLLSARPADLPICLPSVHDEEGRMVTAQNRTVGTLIIKDTDTTRTFGGPEQSTAEGSLRFSLGLDTQFPSLYMRWKRFDWNDEGHAMYHVHRVIFHGNSGMHQVNYYGPLEIQGGALSDVIPADRKEAANEGRLIALVIHMGKSTLEQRLNKCVTVLHGQKDERGFDRWSSDPAMIQTLTTSKMKLNEFDTAVEAFLLGQDCSFILLHEIDAGNEYFMQRLGAEYKFWMRLMRCSINVGPFWFWRTQWAFERAEPHFTRVPQPIPSWLVRTWALMVTSQGLDALVPLTWVPIYFNTMTKKNWDGLDGEIIKTLEAQGILVVGSWDEEEPLFSNK